MPGSPSLSGSIRHAQVRIVTHLSEKYKKLRTPGTGSSVREAGLAQLDDIVGAVLKKLKDTGLDDNAVFVSAPTTGANRLTRTVAGDARLQAEKGDRCWRKLCRAPCIIRWPGKVPAGKVKTRSSPAWIDLRTFVAAAGNPNIADGLVNRGKQLRRPDAQGPSTTATTSSTSSPERSIEAAGDLLFR